MSNSVGAMSNSVGAALADVPEPVLRLEEQIIVLIQRSRQLWREAAAAVHPDLQPIGYRLLTTLVKQGPSNPGRLADLLETDKSVISRQVRVLEPLGLLSVEPDPQDGRGRLLVPTPGACQLLRETRQHALARLDGGLAGLDPVEIDQLLDLLERINGSLEEV